MNNRGKKKRQNQVEKMTKKKKALKTDRRKTKHINHKKLL